MSDQARCPCCGYTEEDKRTYGDHYLCKKGSASPLSTSGIFKMYVWRREPGWIVVAHAKSVAEARALALEESDGMGDASTPVRKEAYKFVEENNPEIFYRENAEFVLTDSGQLEEADAENERLVGRVKVLELELKQLYAIYPGSIKPRNDVV